MTGERAILVGHGDPKSPCLPDLEATFDGMVSGRPSNLMVDLSQTSQMDVATVRAIARRGRSVPHFDLRLPRPT